MSDMLSEAARRGRSAKPIVSVSGGTAEKPVTSPKKIVSVKSDVEAMLPRDQWDRPKIIVPGEAKPVSYRRASTVAEALEDHFGLHRWEMGLLAEGLSQRPDLAMAVHGATKKERSLIIEEALDFAGAGVAARNGTTMHRFTEMVDKGEKLPRGLPANIKAMLDVYRKEFSERFEVLDTERFVVQDKIRVGGTYDKRVRHKATGKVYIGDTKTGQSLDYMALKTCAQVAVYASGKHYDLDGEREDHGAEKDRGVLIWLPWTDEPEEAICEVRWLDLKIGRQAIMEAMRVDNFRKLKPAQLLPLVKE